MHKETEFTLLCQLIPDQDELARQLGERLVRWYRNHDGEGLY